MPPPSGSAWFAVRHSVSSRGSARFSIFLIGERFHVPNASLQPGAFSFLTGNLRPQSLKLVFGLLQVSFLKCVFDCVNQLRRWLTALACIHHMLKNPIGVRTIGYWWSDRPCWNHGMHRLAGHFPDDLRRMRRAEKLNLRERALQVGDPPPLPLRMQVQVQFVNQHHARRLRHCALTQSWV